MIFLEDRRYIYSDPYHVRRTYRILSAKRSFFLVKKVENSLFLSRLFSYSRRHIIIPPFEFYVNSEFHCSLLPPRYIQEDYEFAIKISSFFFPLLSVGR